ncbi:MAG TPA: FAD-dependent monooxygenase [Streptosporangiaceae bacterium]|nr:FAD-dependent monooxygenase [Streptosporangiaceae bacterium]
MRGARPGRVIVVGAGPTGLVLAAELALAGVPCLILERRTGLRADSRAICLHARTMEVFDLRGLADRFAEAGLAVPTFPLGLKGAAIGFGGLDSDFPYLLDMPQSQIEALLAARAIELGAEIRWSAQVTGIEQDADEVRVLLADGGVERAAYVVGCDGTRSFTRQAAGLPFPGTPNPGSVLLADLFLDGLSMTDTYGDLSDRGMLLVFPFRDGSCRLVLYDYARADLPVTEPVTGEEVRASLVSIAGQDFGLRDMAWSARYRSESRQAPAYRNGRIFLAGDAAHTHSPAGAQGMNTGLQDAVNLGWKLAAAAAGWAPDWLLDSYHAERYPVGAAVLSLAGRQFRLNTARTAPRRALRWAMHRVVAPLPPVQARLARDYSGLAIRYPQTAAPGRPAAAGASHPLAGARLPRGRLTGADGDTTRLYDLFHDGRLVLLEADSAGVVGAERNDLPDQVRRVRYAQVAGTRLPAAALVRPDGYLAWASDERDALARARAARAAIGWWCG